MIPSAHAKGSRPAALAWLVVVEGAPCMNCDLGRPFGFCCAVAGGPRGPCVFGVLSRLMAATGGGRAVQWATGARERRTETQRRAALLCPPHAGKEQAQRVQPNTSGMPDAIAGQPAERLRRCRVPRNRPNPRDGQRWRRQGRSAGDGLTPNPGKQTPPARSEQGTPGARDVAPFFGLPASGLSSPRPVTKSLTHS